MNRMTLAELIEHGKAAKRQFDQNRGAAAVARPLRDNGAANFPARAEPSTPSSGPARGGNSSPPILEQTEDLAGRLLMLLRTHATDATALRRELLRTIEAFIVTISQKH